MRNRLAHERKSEYVELRLHSGLHVVGCRFIVDKQPLYFSPQLGIIAAGLVQQSRAFFRVALRGAMEQFLDLRPSFWSQGAPTRLAFDGEARLPPSSSHA